jgi:hypothetical protein
MGRDAIPFKGKTHVEVVQPTRVIARFTKPNGRVAELRERKVTQFAAIEWMLFIDGSMIESRMYHGARLTAYPDELNEVRVDLASGGWIEQVLATRPNA